MYARVRYVDDVKYVVNVAKDIRNFHPRNIFDFDQEKLHKVAWPPSTMPAELRAKQPLENGGFADARVLELSDNYDDLYKGTKNKRKRKDTHKRELIDARETKKKQKADEASSKVKSLKKLVCEMKREVRQNPLYKISENSTLHEEQSTHPQASSISEMDSMYKVKYDSLLEKYKVKKRKYKELKDENKILKKKVEEMNEEIQRSQDALGNNAVEILDIEVQDSEVHLGHGVVINKDKWEHIKLRKKTSIFIKELVVAIWGTEELSHRSVTGRPGNYRKAEGVRRQLTPRKMECIRALFEKRLQDERLCGAELANELKKLPLYIAGKIADINKSKRRLDCSAAAPPVTAQPATAPPATAPPATAPPATTQPAAPLDATFATVAKMEETKMEEPNLYFSVENHEQYSYLNYLNL